MSFSLRKASELVRLNSPLRMPADGDGPLRTDTSHHGDAAARMAASLQLESPSAPLEAVKTRNDGIHAQLQLLLVLATAIDRKMIAVKEVDSSSQQCSTQP